MPIGALAGPIISGLSALGGGSAAQGGLGLATLLGSAFGGRGGGRQRGTREEEFSQRETAQETRTGEARTQEEELAILGPFREALLRGFGEEFERARQPVFGEAQTAQTIQSLNDLARNASQAIATRLGARGALSSGNLATLETGVEQERTRGITDFLTQLPFREAQERLSRTLPFLDLGLGFAGRGPRATATTSRETGEVTSERTGTSRTEQEGVVQGPGFGRNLAGAGGSLAALLLGDRLRRQRLAPQGVGT